MLQKLFCDPTQKRRTHFTGLLFRFLVAAKSVKEISRMKVLPSLVLLRIVSLLIVLVAVPATRSMAQGYQEVELEIAGPWDYVTDPNHSDRIIVIAPSDPNHVVLIQSGADATMSGSPIGAGLYTMDFDGPFDPTKCSAHTPLGASKPLAQKVDITTSTATAVSAAIGATGKRFALSVPRPCYFENFVDARSIIDTRPITNSNHENSYTTWMVLHYTLPTTAKSTLLNGAPDLSGTPFNNYPVMLKNGSSARPALAVSIVLYFAMDVAEDFICDKYSAAFFDASEQFWGLTSPHYRLFPQIDPTTKAQTHIYNYDVKKCSQKFQGARGMSMPHGSFDFLGSIALVRNSLRDSKPREALTALDQVRIQAARVWGQHTPESVINDLKSAKKTINSSMNNPAGLKVVADQVLVTTETVYRKAPGRADCHKAQISINGAVN
jgi:hypothetical protein